MSPIQTQKPKKFAKLANIFQTTRDALKQKLIQPAFFGRQELALAGYGAASKADARFDDKEDISSLFRKPMLMGGGQYYPESSSHSDSFNAMERLERMKSDPRYSSEEIREQEKRIKEIWDSERKRFEANRPIEERLSRLRNEHIKASKRARGFFGSGDWSEVKRLEKEIELEKKKLI